MRQVALLDVETTGVDPQKDVCVEVAVCTFDLTCAAPVAYFSSLIYADHNEAFETNGIPVDMLLRAPAAEVVWRRVSAITTNSEAFVAHNASFDRSFTPEQNIPWICSMDHIPWPKAPAGGGLTKVVLAHGVGVVHAHRAMSDVDTLARLLSRVGETYDLQELFRLAMRPRMKIQSLAAFAENALVKAAGFRWEPEKKRWWKEVPVEDPGSYPFKWVRFE